MPKDTMEKWCEIHAPIFLKHKRLMPLAPVYRILNKDVTKFNWFSELKIVLSA